MMSDKENYSQTLEGKGKPRKLSDAADSKESEMKTFEDEEGLHPILQYLERLRLVRVPGKEKLSMDESIEAALSQGERYRRWFESGELIGAIEVWVDGRNVMTVLPGSSTELQDFAFRVPSPGSAVLQLTTQSSGGSVVLHNRCLGDVPPEGLNYIEAFPNGQIISLDITRVEVDKFSIRITVDPGASEIEVEPPTATLVPTPTPTDTHEVTHKKPQGKAVGMARGAVLALIFALSLCSIMAAYRLGGRHKSVETSLWAVNNLNETDVAAVTDVQSSQWACREDKSDVTSATEAGDPDASFTISASGKSERAQIKQMAQKRARLARAQTVTPISRSESGGIIAANYKASETISRAHTTLPEGVSVPKGTQEEVKQYTKLSALQKVYVQLNGSSKGPAEIDELRTSFIRALEVSKSFEVLGEPDRSQADAVINLRFLPDETCLGAVVVQMSDTNGDPLWLDYVGCRKLPDKTQAAMFNDASMRLVSRLEGTVKIAKITANQMGFYAAAGQ